MDPVSLANLAMSWIGAKPVSAIDGSDPSKAGQLIGQQFYTLCDAVTEDRDWTFATARYQLQADAASPAWGYKTRYLLPPEVLRVITCIPGSAGASLDAFAISLAMQEGTDVSKLDWRQEGRYVLAGAANSPFAGGGPNILDVKAVIQTWNPGLWSPGFQQALAARIAADLCIGITANRELAADMWKLYEQKLKWAAGNDGRQGRSQQRVSDTLARRRR